ncbi:hypothetical protein [Agrobacterium tumefaciens]|uniref:hypothetical protein n=1 Tax=Agrobacterium tumefaciens TaxID=358 RepID=UPI001574228B|nr:hypothetical protein [Agrobacterium tumefaciens]WCK01072.1 hypothetical protein G6L31_007255 [Agrobacterium tumefaciens]
MEIYLIATRFISEEWTAGGLKAPIEARAELDPASFIGEKGQTAQPDRFARDEQIETATEGVT